MVCGILSLALGVAGLLLPLVPTTPFVLLASACFLRASPALHARMMRVRHLGACLHVWERHRAILASTKRLALLGMLLGVTATLAYGSLPAPAMVALLALAAIGAQFLLGLPVVRSAPHALSEPSVVEEAACSGFNMCSPPQ
jgi:uncharacterized membrane protein YbaN (DUF454 family)